jgi:hypothetical protein
MANTAAKKPAAKPAVKKRHVNAFEMLASLENVAVAEDKNIKVAAPVQGDVKKEITDTVNPSEEVGASDKGVKTTQPGPADGGGDGTAVTQDVGKVKAATSTDEANAGEVDSVDGKTANAVKAGEKDITTGVVSQEDNIEANEAEHIEPKTADESVMNVEEAIETLDASGITEASDKAQAATDPIAADLQKMEAVEAALEQYIGLLTTMGKKKQPITPELARAIQISVEAFDPTFFKRTVPSVESFGTPMSRAVVSMELLDNLKANAAKIGGAIKEAVKKLIKAVIDAWNYLSHDAGKLLERLNALEPKLKGGALKSGDKQSVKGADRLSINGNFVGDSLEIVKMVGKVSGEIMVQWPTEVGKLMNLKGEDLEEKAQGVLESTFSSFKATKDTPPSALSKYDHVTQSPVLPGNKAMFIGFGASSTASETVSDDKHLKFDFTSIDGESGGDNEITIPSADKAVAVIKGVKEIVANFMDNTSSQVTNTIRLIESYEKLFNDGGKLSENSGVYAIAKTSLEHQRMFMGWLVSLVKAYIAFYEGLLGGGEVAAGGKSDDGVVSTQ